VPVVVLDAVLVVSSPPQLQPGEIIAATAIIASTTGIQAEPWASTPLGRIARR